MRWAFCFLLLIGIYPLAVLAQGLEDVAAVFQSTKGEASDHWLYDTAFDRQDGRIRFQSPGTFFIELGNYTSIGPIRTERFAYVKDKQNCEVAFREQGDKDPRAIQFSREAFEAHKRLRKDIVDGAISPRQFRRDERPLGSGLSQGAQRDWVRRGTQRRNRIPLGAG
jgi:hypothetical protein